MDKRNTKAAAAAQRALLNVKDRRRVRIGKPVSGLLGAPVPPETSGTIYPQSVRRAFGKTAKVLTPGKHSTKVGGDVLVGRFIGYKLYTLSLEERRTCPRSCDHWRTCYGNSSPFIARWSPSPEFEEALAYQVGALTAKAPLLVRLHMLGDFYSWKYLCLWAELLDRHPNLAAFGFTAHREGTKIGDGIARLREVYPDRFMIRHSGRLGPWGSATIDFPTEKKLIGDALVCPEQLDANSDNPRGVHCGSCAACWQTDRAVIFIEHGYGDKTKWRQSATEEDAEEKPLAS